MNSSTTRFDPHAHRPRTQRLRVGVRGASGTRKSTFAASMADAELGKLCFFDTELKSCHLPGSDGTRFDAFELAQPDELEGGIEWALCDPQGKEQGYGCFALDSWNGWFAPKYAEFLEAKRRDTGTAYPELDGADLQRLQVVCGEVLRPLCVDSRACVVITDTIAGKGLEEKEDNEVGRIVPISASGLEYFVDVLVEAELRIDGGGIAETCVHRVVKTNNRAFPIGLVLEDPTFKDYLDRLGSATIANAETIKAEVREPDDMPVFEPPKPVEPSNEVLLEGLMRKVEGLGFTRENLVTVANKSFGKYVLSDLTPAEILALDERLEAVAKRRGPMPDPAGAAPRPRKGGA